MIISFSVSVTGINTLLSKKFAWKINDLSTENLLDPVLNYTEDSGTSLWTERPVLWRWELSCPLFSDSGTYLCMDTVLCHGSRTGVSEVFVSTGNEYSNFCRFA